MYPAAFNAHLKALRLFISKESATRIDIFMRKLFVFRCIYDTMIYVIAEYTFLYDILLMGGINVVVNKGFSFSNMVGEYALDENEQQNNYVNEDCCIV